MCERKYLPLAVAIATKVNTTIIALNEFIIKLLLFLTELVYLYIKWLI